MKDFSMNQVKTFETKESSNTISTIDCADLMNQYTKFSQLVENRLLQELNLLVHLGNIACNKYSQKLAEVRKNLQVEFDLNPKDRNGVKLRRRFLHCRCRNLKNTFSALWYSSKIAKLSNENKFQVFSDSIRKNSEKTYYTDEALIKTEHNQEIKQAILETEEILRILRKQNKARVKLRYALRDYTIASEKMVLALMQAKNQILK